MTKREFCIAVKELEGCTDEMREVADKIIASLDKKSSTPTKAQKENEEIKEVILNVLSDATDKMTVTEMVHDERLGAYTNQKISALLRQLVEKELVAKVIEKRKTYFIIVG